MFAQRVQLDIGHDHHFVAVRGKQGTVDQGVQALLIAMTQVLHGFGCALGGVEQTFAVRVFTDIDEDFAVMPGQ